MDEFAVARKPVEIVTNVRFLDPASDLLNRSIVVDDITGKPARILLPEFMIAVEDVVWN